MRGRVWDWLAVFVVTSNSAWNAYLSINTSASETAFAKVLDVTNVQIQSMYSIFLGVVVVGMTPGMLLAVRYEWSGVFFSVLTNVVAGFLRWISARDQNFILCAASTAVNAAGAWTILSLPAQISKRRFPREKRTLTTSIMIQGNYFGWMVGSLLPAQIATDKNLVSFCFWQAISTLFPLLFFVLAYRSPAPSEQRPISQTDSFSSSDEFNEGKFCDLITVGRSHPSFLAQVIACGTLAGVGFAQPSVAVLILDHHGFSNSSSTWVNVSFIGSGVAVGLLVGKLCRTEKSYGPMLKALFLLAPACIAACAALAIAHALRADDPLPLAVIIALSMGAGAACCGFLGLGIQAAALYPVGPGYVCWAVEILTQAVGAFLNYAAALRGGRGFEVLAAGALVAAALMVLGFRLPPDEGNLLEAPG